MKSRKPPPKATLPGRRKKVVRNMVRFKKRRSPEDQPSNASSYEKQRVGRYFLQSARTFHFTNTGPFISVAEDGTRLAGLDMMYSCLWAPSLGVGCWLPPQAGLLVVSCVQTGMRNGKQPLRG